MNNSPRCGPDPVLPPGAYHYRTRSDFPGRAGAGIVLTILPAPRSGASTRRLIGRKVAEGKDWVKDKAAAVQDCVRDQGEELRDRAQQNAYPAGATLLSVPPLIRGGTLRLCNFCGLTAFSRSARYR